MAIRSPENQVTKFCRPFPELVGPGHWLPPDSFEFGWADGVGCNNLGCERCGEPVRAEARPESRHYACGCQQHEETGVYRIGAESWELYPIAHFPKFTEWVCGGHPDFGLPAVLDGVQLTASTNWTELVTQAVLRPPFQPPGAPVWIIRLYRLLGEPSLSSAIAGLLTAEDPLLVGTAYDFFLEQSAAAGAEHIAGAVAERREWLGATQDPRRPGSSLLDSATVVLHERLLVVDETGGPIDRRALDLAKELALAGIGPRDAIFSLRDGDSEWLWAHAADLAAVESDWIDSLVYILTAEPKSRQDQVLRHLAGVAPVLVRGAIEDHFPEPRRGELLSGPADNGRAETVDGVGPGSGQ